MCVVVQLQTPTCANTLTHTFHVQVYYAQEHNAEADKHAHFTHTRTRTVHAYTGCLSGSPLVVVEMPWLEFDANTVPISSHGTVMFCSSIFQLIYKDE